MELLSALRAMLFQGACKTPASHLSSFSKFWMIYFSRSFFPSRLAINGRGILCRTLWHCRTTSLWEDGGDRSGDLTNSFLRYFSTYPLALVLWSASWCLHCHPSPHPANFANQWVGKFRLSSFVWARDDRSEVQNIERNNWPCMPKILAFNSFKAPTMAPFPAIMGSL